MFSDQLQIELLDPKQGAVDVTRFVDRFSVLHSALKHGRRWSLDLSTDDWTLWENYMAGIDPLRIRLTFSKSKTPETTGWLKLYVDASEDDFFRERLDGKLRGGDAMLLTAIEDKVAVYSEATADTVALQIAGKYGFSIDTTKMDGMRTWYQLGYTDYKVLKWALSNAATVGGRGDVWLWFDNGKLNFRPFDFKAPSKEKYLLGGTDDRLERAPVGFYGGEVDRAGGRRVVAHSYDPLLDKFVTFTAGAPSAGGQALSTFVPRTPQGGLMEYGMSDAEQALVRATARAQWAKMGTRYYGLTLGTKGTMRISVGDMVEVDFLKETIDKGAFVRGRYPVFETEHVYANGEFRTFITGYRREAGLGEVAATGANVSSSRGTDAYLKELMTGTPGQGRTTRVTARTLG